MVPEFTVAEYKVIPDAPTFTVERPEIYPVP